MVIRKNKSKRKKSRKYVREKEPKFLKHPAEKSPNS
jgi:hypothetical protein